MHDPIVSLVRCESYERKQVRDAVARAIELVPGADALLQSGARVLLKPNLLSSADPPEKAVNTHPEFVRAAAKMCRDRGCRVLIGDSCGSLSSGSTARAIEVTGLNQVAEETGAEIIDCDHTPVVDVPILNGRILQHIEVSNIIREVDLIITLPKLKTHGLTLLTGAVKNQLGLLPGKRKKEVHLAAPKPAAMAQALVDIYSVVRPQLALMDGIVGMEGNGPEAGPPRQVGVVAAAFDCVALDAVVGAIMGYGPREVLTTRFAHEQGLGMGDMERITIVGIPLAEAIVSGFVTPHHRIHGVVWKFMPAAVARWLFDQIGSARPEILEEQCVRCGECVTNCPTRAMHTDGDQIVCEHGLCISCYCCTEVCEQRAIEMKRPFMGRLIQAMASRKRPD